MTVLSTYGWETPICPTIPAVSQKYFLDENHILALGLGNKVGRFINLSGEETRQIDYFSRLATAMGYEARSAYIKGKNAITVYVNYGTFDIGSSYTLEFWCIPTISSSIVTMRLTNAGNPPMITVGVGGLNTYFNGFSDRVIPKSLNMWQAYFIRIVVVNGVLNYYVDGSLIGSVVWQQATSFTYLGVDEGFPIKDFIISNVARDGAYVPGNLIGF